MGHHYLNQVFSPASVAVFGASERENAVGTLLLKNMLAAEFKGDIYPVNPKYKTVQGLTCYPDIHKINKSVDLAIIAIPANKVINIVRECGEIGCRGVVVLSSGFSDNGVRGKRLEAKLLEVVHEYGLHLIGPNCLGIMRPQVGLNATFSNNQARMGNVALVSQSGAMATAILDWAATRQVGFSTVATLGDAADVDFGDVLDYLAL
ncbi:MAG: GNAT family N-acetyltransferase, partial [Thiothrix nivea]